MPIMNWIKRYCNPRRRTIYSTQSIDFGYGLEEFRSDPSNVSAVNAILESPIGKKILSVLHFHRPRGYPVRGRATVEDAALEHMRREGHEGCIELLMAMGRTVGEETEEVPITWGVEDDEDEAKQ